MFLILLASTVLGIMSTQWVMAWLSLELNTLSMCWLLSTEENNNKKDRSSSLTYFLIQVMASMLILWGMVMGVFYVALGGMFLKMGLWPLHYWYLKVVTAMSSISHSFLMIFTWQKVLPIFLMYNMVKTQDNCLFLLFFVTISMMAPVGALGDNVSFKGIIGLSSVNNNGWLILSSFCSLKVFVIYLSVYAFSLKKLLSVSVASLMKTKKMIVKSSITLMFLANLGGIPPLPVFWVKVLALKVFVINFFSSVLLLAVLVMACLFLYYLLTLGASSLLEETSKNSQEKKCNSGATEMLVLVCLSSLVFMLI